MQARIMEHLSRAGLDESMDTASALVQFLVLLSRWNAVHNLTAVTEPEEMIRRHLVESLALGAFLRGSSIADVGSGGGLPGIPLAIARPGLQFTLIESRGKRAGFLRHVKGALGLENVTVEHGRVEDLSATGPFDTVLARAVAPLPRLLELTGHLFGSETRLVALTGEGAVDEPMPGGYRIHRVTEPVAGLSRGNLVIVESSGS